MSGASPRVSERRLSAALLLRRPCSPGSGTESKMRRSVTEPAAGQPPRSRRTGDRRGCCTGPARSLIEPPESGRRCRAGSVVRPVAASWSAAARCRSSRARWRSSRAWRSSSSASARSPADASTSRPDRSRSAKPGSASSCVSRRCFARVTAAASRSDARCRVALLCLSGQHGGVGRTCPGLALTIEQVRLPRLLAAGHGREPVTSPRVMRLVSSTTPQRCG